MSLTSYTKRHHLASLAVMWAGISGYILGCAFAGAVSWLLAAFSLAFCGLYLGFFARMHLLAKYGRPITTREKLDRIMADEFARWAAEDAEENEAIPLAAAPPCDECRYEAEFVATKDGEVTRIRCMDCGRVELTPWG